MNEDEFVLNLETFCRAYKVSELCKYAIAKFLTTYEYYKSIKELYAGFIERQKVQWDGDISFLTDRLTHKSEWDKNFLDAASQKEMIRQLYYYFDTVNEGTKINWYCFPLYDENGSFCPGVILNQNLVLDYRIDRDQPLFRLLFASMLSQTAWPGKFLKYHFDNSFESNRKRFLAFLTETIDDYKDIIANRMGSINIWLKDLSEPLDQQNNVSSFQNALILYISMAANSNEFVNKENALKDHATRLEVSPKNFRNNYFKIQKLFTEGSKKLIPKIQSVIPHLSGIERTWAQQKILELR